MMKMVENMFIDYEQDLITSLLIMPRWTSSFFLVFGIFFFELRVEPKKRKILQESTYQYQYVPINLRVERCLV